VSTASPATSSSLSVWFDRSLWWKYDQDHGERRAIGSSNWFLYSVVIESESVLAEFDPSSSGVTNPRVDIDGTVICNSMLLISVPGIVIALCVML
ncbi:hypothetical protein ISN45_Aa08g022770, partial [Arabidopsis thaliana x Arabidopsis arenosa]